MNCEHLYTIHATYTGEGCAMCGKDPHPDHALDFWFFNGEKIVPPFSIVTSTYTDSDGSVTVVSNKGRAL
jgi:hypothetical protein